MAAASHATAAVVAHAVVLVGGSERQQQCSRADLATAAPCAMDPTTTVAASPAGASSGGRWLFSDHRGGARGWIRDGDGNGFGNGDASPDGPTTTTLRTPGGSSPGQHHVITGASLSPFPFHGGTSECRQR
uniref:Uncharacterized protein n=1 Tax=Oryza nivara TaxID=4536 RepID=A0A2I4S639_ORYNI|nr:hypothetical protein NIV_17 [Oryza sativa f. spontanea]